MNTGPYVSWPPAPHQQVRAARAATARRVYIAAAWILGVPLAAGALVVAVVLLTVFAPIILPVCVGALIAKTVLTIRPKSDFRQSDARPDYRARKPAARPARKAPNRR